MDGFSILVKPASADCNLRCEDCFYLAKSALYPQTKVHRMTGSVLERLVEGYLATTQREHAFVWQGGEPTLMGPAFFEEVVALQARYRRPGQRVTNALQTNGTAITDALASLARRHDFLVGVSVDGPAELHDRRRVDPSSRGTYARVLRGLETLARHGVETNVLTLVRRQDASEAARIYAHHRDRGWRYQQYIPCVDAADASLDGQRWGAFLLGLFESWYPVDVERVSIRTFDAVIAWLVHGVTLDCTMAESCGMTLVVEHDGDVFPCDFYVEPAERLGNVATHSFPELAEGARRFGLRKCFVPACRACRYVSLCHGGCPRYRPTLEAPTILCEGWKAFLDHALPRLRPLADELSRHRTAVADRNQPCPCGSGRKWKRCHGRP